jgi:hypothetical protein
MYWTLSDAPGRALWLIVLMSASVFCLLRIPCASRSDKIINFASHDRSVKSEPGRVPFGPIVPSALKHWVCPPYGWYSPVLPRAHLTSRQESLCNRSVSAAALYVGLNSFLFIGRLHCCADSSPNLASPAAAAARGPWYYCCSCRWGQYNWETEAPAYPRSASVYKGPLSSTQYHAEPRQRHLYCLAATAG